MGALTRKSIKDLGDRTLELISNPKRKYLENKIRLTNYDRALAKVELGSRKKSGEFVAKHLFRRNR